MSVLTAIIWLASLIAAYSVGWSDRGMEEQFNRDLDRITELTREAQR